MQGGDTVKCPLNLPEPDCEECEFGKKGLCDHPHSIKGKMATMLRVPPGAIKYDRSVDAMVCGCGCGMEISTKALQEVTGSQESRVFRKLHQHLIQAG